jgi:lysophospholipase
MQRNLRGEMTLLQGEQLFSLPYKNRAIVRAVLSATRPNVDTAKEWDDVDDQERAEVERNLYPILLCFAAASGDLEGLHTMEHAFGGTLQLNCVDYAGFTPLASSHITTTFAH